MQSITIGRYDSDPEAQGVIKPEDGRWQLVIDKDGFPHLYVEVDVEDDDGQVVKGMFNIDDMLHGFTTVREIMEGGTFGGKLSPEDEAEAFAEFQERKAKHAIPCPR